MSSRAMTSAVVALGLAIALGAFAMWQVLELSASQDDEARTRADEAEAVAMATAAATEANRLTLCAAARIISRSPAVQLPSESPGHYRKRLAAYEDFLRLSRRIDCRVILAEFKREERARERDEDEAPGIPPLTSPPAPQPSPDLPERGPQGPRGKRGKPSPQPSPPPPSPGNSEICTPGVLPNLPAVCVQ